MDFTARLRIGAAWRVPVVAVPISISVAVPIPVPVMISVPVVIPISIAVSVIIVIAAGNTAKLAIDIFNCAIAAREGFKRSVHPSSLPILAASAQKSIANTNIPASLGVTTRWQGAILFANQAAISIGNIAPAAVRGIQHRIMVATAIVLATRA
jgi:hypothetical protein